MADDNNRKVFLIYRIIACLAFLILLIRLFVIAVEGFGLQKSLYDDPKVAREVIRGEIRDRNGNLLAIQTGQYALFFVMKNIDDLTKASMTVAPYLGMSIDEVMQQASRYSVRGLIKRGLTEEVARALEEAVKANGLEEGIILEKYQGRSYPATFHASQLIGFVNTENKGLEGIEFAYDDELLPYPELNEELTYGDNITLTLDLNIQYLLDVQVQTIAMRDRPDYIMGMVVDAQTGEVLASSSYPWYDLNTYSTSDENARMNRCLGYTYEPGSVFKVFSLAAAMEAGVDTETLFICDGEETFYHKGQSFTITCHEPHGECDARGMVAKSCNGAIASWALKMGDEYFDSFLRSLGFAQRYDVGLEGVTRGTLSSPKEWSARSQATISFGQEISVNALQIVSAATTLVDGEHIMPSFIKKIEKHNGDVIYENSIKKERIFSSETASKIRSYMQSATEEGTATLASVKGIDVAAKTGTAQIINPISKSYEDGTSLASTLALVPADDPKYIVYFAASAPNGDSIWGANVAAPSCGAIIRGLVSQGKLKVKGQEKLQLN